MFHRILVPLDGSTRAERAIPVAARLARASGGTVILAQAIAYLNQYDPAVAPLIVTPKLLQRQLHEASAYLARLTQGAALTGVATRVAIEVGVAASVILEVAASEHADAIVMTSHGRTGFARWALGSVAQHIATRAPAPVLIVQDQAIQQRVFAAADRPLRALVPLDGSPVSERALEPTLALVEALSASGQGVIHLMKVVPAEEEATRQAAYALLLESVTKYLTRTAAETKAKHPTSRVSWSIESDADIASGILRVTEEGNEDATAAGGAVGYDLIGMATHGRTGVARWVVGSVTDRVLHTTRRPILVVRPPAIAAEEAG
ncbi:MAG TPA: universal stress protein [Ktedonobacterales bacterium]|nr:universal stress protein [Ktedonobacterales bacterium]